MCKPLAALFVLCLAASTVRIADATPRASEAASLGGAAAGTAVGAKPACIVVTTSTRMNVGGYDHIVTLTSSCKKDAACVVSTDVAPEPQSVSVPKGESVDVLTFRASPASEFKATVACTGGI